MIQVFPDTETIRVTPEGDLDAPQVQILRPAVRQALADAGRHLVFDLGHTRFMCSAGLGMLVDLHNLAAGKGGGLRVENLSPAIAKLLSDTKLLGLFHSPPAPETRLRALEAVQEHMNEELLFLSFINTLSSNILLSESPADIYEQTLEAIVRSLKPRRALLMLAAEGETGSELRLAASEGYDEPTRAALELLALDPRSLEGRCLTGKQPMLFGPGWDAGGGVSPLLAAAGCREGILEPLAGRTRALGLILVEAREDPSTFFPQSAPALQAFANMCGLAVEKQSLLDAIRYKNEQLSRTLWELNRTQDTLMQAGKLAILAALGRGLGHALNNKLVPIMGYAQMLALQLEPESPAGEKVAVIERSATEIKRIIDNMRSLSRRDRLEFEPQDLREVLDASLQMLDFLFREGNICVDRRYGETEVRADIHRESLIQAFLALFHRLPMVCTGEEKRLAIEVHAGAGEVELRFFDNGRVIPAPEIEAIHQPFDYNGPLQSERFNFSIVRSILRDHKGGMEIHSTPEMGGTLVTLTLPLRHDREARPVVVE